MSQQPQTGWTFRRSVTFLSATIGITFGLIQLYDLFLAPEAPLKASSGSNKKLTAQPT